MIPGDLIKTFKICDGGYSVPIIGLFLKSRVVEDLGVLEHLFFIEGEIEVFSTGHVKKLVSLV